MTATGHALIGVALAAAIPDPRIGIPVAILSHVAADAFPHWDTGTNMRKKSRKTFVIQSFIDLGISLIVPFIVVAMLFPSLNTLYAYIMVIAAQGFDWATAPYNFLGWHFAPFTWFQWMQKSFDHRLDKPWGIVGQVALILLLFLVSLHKIF